MSVPAMPSLMPATARPKKGSEKTIPSGSGTTIASVLERPVARDLADALGT